MDWNWSFRAFRLLGTDIRIHWTLPAFFFYYLLRAARHDISPTFLGLFVVTPFVLLFASVVCHELGHVLAARHFGLHVGYTILTPVGGMVMVGRARTPWSEFVVAACGPLVNLGLGAIGLGLYLALGGPLAAGMVLPIGADESWLGMAHSSLGVYVLRDFVGGQSMLFWFNVLMVAYPMDGGRMLLAGLWSRMGFSRALRVSCRVSQVLAVVVGLVALVTLSPMLAVIAVFLWVQAAMALRQLQTSPEQGLGWSMDPSPGGSRRTRGAPGSRSPWRVFQDWLERRRARHYLELVAKASTHGLDALGRSDRAFMRRQRERDKDKLN